MQSVDAAEPMATADRGDYLTAGEKVVWSGRPAQGLLLTSRDWGLIPFSLFVCGFAIFWESMVLSQPNAPIFMKFFGAPFILFGLYAVAGRFLLDAWVREGIQYAVTNKRVLMIRSWPFARFTALSLGRLPETSLVEGANGRGTILFGQPIPYYWRGSGISGWTPSLDPTPAFIAIENARSVFDQIQSADRSNR
jgi:hypothetical protein